MNAAHFHIVINHFPVVLMLASATIAIHGWIRKSAEVKRVALIMAVVAASFTLATYFSGEPAADFLENAAIVNDMHIEDHEEAAEKSVIITTLTGLAAAAAFFLASRKSSFADRAYLIATGLSVLSASSLGWTGSKGAIIRHPEVSEQLSNGSGISRPSTSGAAGDGDIEESSDQTIETEFETGPAHSDHPQ